ncbi:MAG: hypothetical protein GF411_17560 [Candidatus Lokiarchaeota archaeon]|nr:hypothetical protein [Candidatus Lokiarchaeota archaeon]
MNSRSIRIKNGHEMCISIQTIFSVVLLVYLCMMPLFVSATSFSPRNATHIFAADEPQVTLSYYSLWNTTPTPISSGAHISGDHVILLAEWVPSALIDNTSIEVHAPAIPITLNNESLSESITIDTRSLGNNATCVVNVTAWLTNGTAISELFSDIFIGNFFVPSVSLLTPTGSSIWTGVNVISWTATDPNIAETLTFDVFLSSDSGQSYQEIAQDLSNMSLEWNTTGLIKNDTYRIRVRVTDGIYSNYDTSESFIAGDVIITPTTTETTTTTTSTTPTTTSPDVITAAFIVAAIISSGIMAIVVYYVARKWF